MKFEDAIRLSKIQSKNTRRKDLDEISSSSDTDEQDNKTVSDSNNIDLKKKFHDKKRNSLYNYDIYGVKSIGDIYTQNSYREGPLKEFDDAKVISIVTDKIIQNNRDSSVTVDRILDKTGDKVGNIYECKRKVLPKIEFSKRDFPNNLIKIESQKMTLIDNNSKEKEIKSKFIA